MVPGCTTKLYEYYERLKQRGMEHNKLEQHCCLPILKEADYLSTLQVQSLIIGRSLFRTSKPNFH